MTVSVEFAKLEVPESGTAVVLVASERQLGRHGAEIDAKTSGMLTRAMANGRFTGALETSLLLESPSGVSVNRILLAGVGDPTKLSEVKGQKVGGGVVARLRLSGESDLVVVVDELTDSAIASPQLAAQLALGAKLRSYRFDRFLTKEKPEKKPSLKHLSVFCEQPAAAKKSFERLSAVADGVFLARDLLSEPANVLNPVRFAECCLSLESDDVEVEILDKPQLEKIGMGALLGVAQGSVNEPRVVVMRYRGDPESESPLAFVGKGVTFDSGGISIKPAKGMQDMKMDMGGAAAVTGLMLALARRKAKVDAVGVIGLVENMPSGSSYRPGDILTSLSGQTIEVLNTDAEGRLVLADLLWHTHQQYRPRLMLDLATLTGAIRVALGDYHAGLFSNRDDLAAQLTQASEKSGETVWRMPLSEQYDKMLDSSVADMQNISDTGFAGSITAAQFLQRFVDDATPWAHLDIAGVAWVTKSGALSPKGGVGFGVRLLDQLIFDSYEAH